MGGLGSGRWSDIVTRKTAVEQCRCLSIKQLRLAGFLAGDCSGVITYTNSLGKVTAKADLKIIGSDDVEFRLSVQLDNAEKPQFIDLPRTSCNYGGWRFWFTCPVSVDGVFCGNQCESLYLPLGASYFGCRKCYDLTYLSRQENHKHDRAIGYIDKVNPEELSIIQTMRLSAL